MDTKTIQIKLEKISEENHLTEMKFFINKININEYKIDNQLKTSTWNFDDLIDYFLELLVIIDKDEPFPYDIEGNTAIELELNARNFDTDDDELFVKYYEKLNEWAYQHSWSHTCTGCYISDVMFRRVGHDIEISWNNKDLYDGVEFSSLQGRVTIPFEEFKDEIMNSIHMYKKIWSQDYLGA